MSAIERIGQSIQNIETNYKEFDDTVFNNGGVDEYTVTIHKKLLKEIMELFKAIAKFPDLLNNEFSTNQMNKIAILAESLMNDQHNGSILNEDSNRSLISRMRVVFGEKEALQYQSEKDKLRELMVKVEEMLKKEEFVSSMNDDIKSVKDQLGSIAKSQKQAQQGLAYVENKRTEVDSVLNDVVNTKSKEIEEKRSAIVAFFGEIVQGQKDLQELEEQNTEFVQKIKENEEEYKKKREENLQRLEGQNAEFSEKLKKDDTEYSEKRDEVLKTAEEMLDLANAGGLAGAFNQRIDKAKEKRRLPWIVLAIVFIMVAIVIALLTSGVNILGFSIVGTDFKSIWARISITTLPLLAAYFCAAQYLKLERTLEDYQYKKALAQSMPAFMEQLGKDNEEYRTYLVLALQQMLQDPLRKKHDVPLLFTDLSKKALEKLLKSTPKE